MKPDWSGRFKTTLVALTVGYVLFFLGSLLANGQYAELRQMVGLIGIYAILALSLNAICGLTGLLQLGHAGFFAIGAYAAALLAIYATRPAWGAGNLLPAMLLAMLAAAAASLVIGLPCLRLRGDYLAIATLGFGEIVKQVLDNLEFRVDQQSVFREYFLYEAGYFPDEVPVDPILTGGSTGIAFPADPSAGGGLWENFPGYDGQYATWWLIWFLVFLTYLFFRNLKRSRIGRALMCIREDEIAAQAMGIHVPRYKLLAFVLSAAFAGLAGALFFHKELMVAPGDFQLLRSIEVLLMVVLGGLGSFSGAILAAVILGLIPDVLRRVDFSDLTFLPESLQALKLGEYQAILYALLLIVLIRLAPDGILGLEELPFGWGRPRRGPPTREGGDG